MYNYIHNLDKVCTYYEKNEYYKIKGVIGRFLWIIGFNSEDLRSFYSYLLKSKKKEITFVFQSEEELLIAKGLLIILKIGNKSKIIIKYQRKLGNYLKKIIFFYKVYLYILNFKYNLKIRQNQKTDILFFWDKYKYIEIYKLLKPTLGRKFKLLPFMNNFVIEKYLNNCLSQKYKLNFLSGNNFSNKFDIVNKLLKDTLIEIKPKKVIFAEGDSPFHSVLTSVCKELNIETICLQWGSTVWKKPRYGFRDLTCNKFLLHGKFFFNEVKNYNKIPKLFITGNLLLKRKNLQKENKAIFLLQPKHVDPNNQFFKLMENMIIKNKEWFFLIRPHPNQDNFDMIKKYDHYKNVKIVNTKVETINQSLEKCKISISSYSSAIIDAFNYNVVPLIFNTSPLLKKYNPNIDKNKLGIETKSLPYAKKEFNKIFKNQKKLENYKKNVIRKKNFFAVLIDKKAIRKTTDIILGHRHN